MVAFGAERPSFLRIYVTELGVNRTFVCPKSVLRFVLDKGQVLRAILTVTAVWNTGETGDIYACPVIPK